VRRVRQPLYTFLEESPISEKFGLPPETAILYINIIHEGEEDLLKGESFKTRILEDAWHVLLIRPPVEKKKNLKGGDEASFKEGDGVETRLIPHREKP